MTVEPIREFSSDQRKLHPAVGLRFPGLGVVVVKRGGDDAGDLDLCDRTVGGGRARAGGGDLPLEQVDDVADGGVVAVKDLLSCGRVGQGPQD